MLRTKKTRHATATGKHAPINLTTVLTEVADVQKVVLLEPAEATDRMVPREMASAPTHHR
jgi:hypothetical protein